MSGSINIMGEAYELVTITDRVQRIKKADRLGSVIMTNLGWGAPVVRGEAGTPNWCKATRHLTERASLHPIEAWMVAEVVAAGAVAAHELANVEVISDERLEDLTEHLAMGALRLTGSPNKT